MTRAENQSPVVTTDVCGHWSTAPAPDRAFHRAPEYLRTGIFYSYCTVYSYTARALCTVLSVDDARGRDPRRASTREQSGGERRDARRHAHGAWHGSRRRHGDETAVRRRSRS